MIHIQNEFIRHFQPLFREVKNVCHFGFFIREELGRKSVIGINAKAPSLLKKDFTIKQINEHITAKNLPLETSDTYPETTMFKIVLKK